MCQHLYMLAACNAYRRVAQCEHGTVHFTWDIATLHLGPEDFLTLERLLSQWAESGEQQFSIEGWGQLVCDSRGTARIWAGQAGLAVVADDLLLLRALVREAAAALQHASRQPRIGGHAVLHHPILTIDAGALASN